MSKQLPHSTLDRSLFEQLFKKHFVHLCNFAQQYVQDTDAAKDVVQKVYIHLWEQREKMKPEQGLRSYLFTAVKNRCLNYIRDQKKYRSHFLDVELEDHEAIIEEDHLALEELEGKVQEALNALPEKCRKVFEMSRYQNMKYQAIAEELGIAQKTVEAHMSKALKSLRASLGDYWPVLLLFLGI